MNSYDPELDHLRGEVRRLEAAAEKVRLRRRIAELQHEVSPGLTIGDNVQQLAIGSYPSGNSVA